MEKSKLVGLRQIADYLGVSPWSIYRWLRKELNAIPRYKIGRKWLFDIQEVDQWIRANKKG